MGHDRFLTHLVILNVFLIAMNTRPMLHPNTQTCMWKEMKLFISFCKKIKISTLVCVSHYCFGICPRLCRQLQPAVQDSRKDIAVIATCKYNIFCFSLVTRTGELKVTSPCGPHASMFVRLSPLYGKIKKCKSANSSLYRQGENVVKLLHSTRCRTF